MTNEPASIPAATLVVFRHGAGSGPPDLLPPEILMLQRAKAMRFAGGAAVFPGGRVDPADGDLAIALAPELVARGHRLAHDDLTARIAAIRETLEEAGLGVGLAAPVTASQVAEARARLLRCGALGQVLAEMGGQLRPEVLEPFARWCQPKAGGFDTRFYLADLGTGAVDVAVDATENTRLFWASARDSLAMADAGEIAIIFPTRRNLERLAQYDSFAATCQAARQTPQPTITPQIVMQAGEPWLTIPEGLGYPVLGEPTARALRG